jgi:hypothetical protein
MVDAATICRVFEQEHGPLSWLDLELLASIEDMYRENEATPPSPEEADDGEGC